MQIGTVLPFKIGCVCGVNGFCGVNPMYKTDVYCVVTYWYVEKLYEITIISNSGFVPSKQTQFLACHVHRWERGLNNNGLCYLFKVRLASCVVGGCLS